MWPWSGRALTGGPQSLPASVWPQDQVTYSPPRPGRPASHQRHIHSDLPCLSMARRLLIGLLAGRAVSLLGVSLWCSLSWLLVSGSVFGFTTIPYIHPPEANTYVALLPKSILCGVFPGQIENELGAESARKLHAALFRCLPSTP